MFANVLAGPTVEQQGEMARSGGRMLATLEPEQVTALADRLFSFQIESCHESCLSELSKLPFRFVLPFYFL